MPHVPVLLYHIGGAHDEVVALDGAAPDDAEGFADEEVGCVAVGTGGSGCLVAAVGGVVAAMAVASVVVIVATIAHVRGIKCVTVVLGIRGLGEVQRHEDADGAEQGAKDKVGRVVQEGGLALEGAGLVDEGFGGGVAFDDVALEHLFAVAWEGHEVVGLDLEEGGEEDEVIGVCTVVSVVFP